MADSPNAVDIFHREQIFPDASGLISWSPQELDAVKNTACVVLDTNALLVPYATGKDSLKEIGNTYRTLVAQKRLSIPSQVVREFATNRAKNLQELHQQLMLKKNVKLSRASYPLLEDSAGHSAMVALERELEAKIQEYRKSVDNVLTEVRGWYWNDPVTRLYKELFSSDIVVDANVDQKLLIEDLHRRIRNKIPPGYKDAAKDDEGIGDLIIWHTILHIGETKKLPLIFVSGDQKPDWWYRSENIPLYPRFELVDEYRRRSEGQSFHMMSLSAFLEVAGASTTLIQEVREEEAQALARSSLIVSGDDYVTPKFNNPRTPENAEAAAARWLQLHYGRPIRASRSNLFDYEMAAADGSRTGVRMRFAPNNPPLRDLKAMVGKLSSRFANVLASSQNVADFIVVLIADKVSVARSLAEKASDLRAGSRIRIVAGYVDDEGQFEPTSSGELPATG